MDETLTVDVHRALPQNTPFICATWVNWLALDDRNCRWSTDLLMDVKNREIDKFIHHPDAEFWVATGPKDKDYVMGWMATMTIGGEKILLYAYVKAIYQRQRIALQLLAGAGLTQQPIRCWYWNDNASAVSKNKPNLFEKLWRKRDGLQKKNQRKSKEQDCTANREGKGDRQPGAGTGTTKPSSVHATNPRRAHGENAHQD